MWLLHAFIAKTIYQLPTTEALIDALRSPGIRIVVEGTGEALISAGAQLRDIICPRGWITGANVGKTDLGTDGPRHGCYQKRVANNTTPDTENNWQLVKFQENIPSDFRGLT